MSMSNDLAKFEFPTEFKELISSIRDKKQWEILEFLIQNNNQLSYSKLQRKLKISDTGKFKLTYHLKELVKNGWLRNQVKKSNKIDREKSFYRISDFGLKMLSGAIKTMNIESYKTNMWNELVISVLATSSINSFDITQIKNSDIPIDNTGWGSNKNIKRNLGSSWQSKAMLPERTMNTNESV